MAETNPLSSVGDAWSGVLSSSGDIIIWLIFGLLIMGGLYLVYFVLSHKHIVVIKQKIGKPVEHYKHEETEKDKTFSSLTLSEKIKVIPYVVSVHRGRIVSKKGVKHVSLLFKKIRLKIPEQVFQAITKRGKKYLEYTQLSEHLYAPTYLVDDESGEHRHLFDESYFDWAINDIEQDAIKYQYQSFWDKYGNWVLSAGTLIIVLLIIVVTLKHSQAIVESAKPLAEALSNAANEFANAMSSQKVK